MRSHCTILGVMVWMIFPVLCLWAYNKVRYALHGSHVLHTGDHRTTKLLEKQPKARFTYAQYDESYHKGLPEAHTEQRNGSWTNRAHMVVVMEDMAFRSYPNP